MIRTIVAAGMMAALVMGGPLYASEKMEMSKEERSKMYKEEKTETLKMLKEIMVILKDMNHYPSPEQKSKLEEMIKKAEKMIGKM